MSPDEAGPGTVLQEQAKDGERPSTALAYPTGFPQQIPGSVVEPHHWNRSVHGPTLSIHSRSQKLISYGGLLGTGPNVVKAIVRDNCEGALRGETG